MKASTYKLLAGGLAAKGIITVRIDKRGMFDSAGAVADANAVTIDDYAVDLHAWVKVIRAKTGASCVWLLGHSEGGLVALASSRNAGVLRSIRRGSLQIGKSPCLSCRVSGIFRSLYRTLNA